MRQAALDGNSIAFVTHVIPVFGARPSDFVEILKPLASDNTASIIPMDRDHLLVLQDRPDNVKRMVDLASTQVLIEAVIMEASWPNSIGQA